MHTAVKRRAVTTAALLVLTGGVLAACGNEDQSNQDPSATSNQGFNGADVAFAEAMIPHHRQALEMAAMTEGKDLDPQVQAIADDIAQAQEPEIETMSGWLRDWGREVPEESMDGMDHSGGGTDHGGATDQDMPGMMSESEMADIEDATGSEFQTMWLEMMIEHHQGAVAMAKVEQKDGQFEPAKELAADIESAQNEEIGTMQTLLEGS